MEIYLKAYNTESEYNASKSSFKNNTVSTHVTGVEYDKFDSHEGYKAVTSSTTFSLGQWRIGQVFSAPKAGYFVLESNSNWNVHSSKSVIKVPFPNGMTSATVYYYSDGESSYDYTILSCLDKDLSNLSETNSIYYVGTTKGDPKTWKSYTYSIPNDGKAHFFTACYRKDSSGHTSEDRGAIAINFGGTFSYYKNDEKYLGIRNGQSISSEETPYVILNDKINYSKDGSLKGSSYRKINSYAKINSGYSSWKLSKNSFNTSPGYYHFHTSGTVGETSTVTAKVTSSCYLEVLIPKNFGEFKCKYNPPKASSTNGRISIAYSNTRISTMSFSSDKYIIKDVQYSGETTVKNFSEDTYLYIWADNNYVYSNRNGYFTWNTPTAWVELPQKLFEGIYRERDEETVTVNKIAPLEEITIQKGSKKVAVGGTSTLYALTNPVIWEKENLIWESSNTDIATVDSYGTVKGISKGEATITVSSPDRKFSASNEIETILVAPYISSYSIYFPTSEKLNNTTTTSLEYYFRNNDGNISGVSIYKYNSDGTYYYDGTCGDVTFTKDTFSITWKKAEKLLVKVYFNNCNTEDIQFVITIKE